MLRYLSPLHKSTRQISVWFEERLSGLGVSPQEGHLLSFLRSYSPSPVAGLARVFGLKNSTLTSLLDRLESRGLVTRSVNPDDRRSFLVKLTRKGKGLAGKVQRLVEEIESEIDSRTTERDLAGFRRVMNAIEEATGITLR